MAIGFRLMWIHIKLIGVSTFFIEFIEIFRVGNNFISYNANGQIILSPLFPLTST